MRKTILFLAFLASGLALVALLSGCAAPQQLKGSGAPADAPIGYLIDCVKNPDQEHCKP